MRTTSRKAEESSKNPGGLVVFAGYLYMNVRLTGNFWVRYGAISRGFALLFGTLYCDWRLSPVEA